jgi:hypothetical protein
MYLANVSQADALIRQMTASQWTARNYVLRSGELGIESDTGKQKVGDGRKWADTPYFTPTGHTGLVSIEDANNAVHLLTFTNGILTAYAVS